jgi:type IV pilus assembly protein PilC
MLYRYVAVEQTTGQERRGEIDAANRDLAIAALQHRGFVIMSINEEGKKPDWMKNITIFEKKVKYKDVVILSRQISTLFLAQVPALRIFQLLAAETENIALRLRLESVSEDLRAGMPVAQAMSKFPDTFTPFYTNMVRAGEESGNLSKTFEYLADYLDRTYELINKTKKALVYPAFVISIFFIVMIMMLVVVIPKLTVIITETGKELPFYTKIVIAMSNSLINYGLYILIVLVVLVFFAIRYAKSQEGAEVFAQISLNIPYIGDLYRKLYLSRICDNINTMVSSGVAMVRAVEISAEVVDNELYKKAMTAVAQDVRTGVSLSGALGKTNLVPQVMVQMVRVGEETGEVGNILETLSKFYKREVDNEVDTIVGLIEPAMILLLGLGVGGLLTSVLMPIYDITSSF